MQGRFVGATKRLEALLSNVRLNSDRVLFGQSVGQVRYADGLA